MLDLDIAADYVYMPDELEQAKEDHEELWSFITAKGCSKQHHPLYADKFSLLVGECTCCEFAEMLADAMHIDRDESTTACVCCPIDWEKTDPDHPHLCGHRNSLYTKWVTHTSYQDHGKAMVLAKKILNATWREPGYWENIHNEPIIQTQQARTTQGLVV